jgi:hypothetical protein
MYEHARRGQFAARFESSEGVCYIIVPLEDMMKFETIELLLGLSNLLSVCRYAGVMAI